MEVPVDSQVRLQVTSDVDDELHVHGFEVEEELEAGRTTTVELTTDQQGVFDVETHESGLLLLQPQQRRQMIPNRTNERGPTWDPARSTAGRLRRRSLEELCISLT